MTGNALLIALTICSLKPVQTAAAAAAGVQICFCPVSPLTFSSCHPCDGFPGETTVEETYDRMFTVTSRVRFSVTKEDDGMPVDCIIDHPAVKDLLAQRHLEVLCE